MVPSLLIALGLTLAAPAYAQQAVAAPKTHAPKPAARAAVPAPSSDKPTKPGAGETPAEHERATEAPNRNAGSSANNPFLRNAVPAKNAATAAPAAPPVPVQPEVPPELNPVKLNGKRLGAVNGKSVYRDGEAYFFDDTDKPLSKREREAALAPPPAQVLAQPAVPATKPEPAAKPVRSASGK